MALLTSFSFSKRGWEYLGGRPFAFGLSELIGTNFVLSSMEALLRSRIYSAGYTQLYVQET